MRSGPSHLVAVRHLAQRLARLGGPLQLDVVEGLFFFDAAFERHQALDGLFIEFLKSLSRGAAHATHHRLEVARGIATHAADVRDRVGGVDLLFRHVLGDEAHLDHGRLGEHAAHGLHDDIARDDRMPPFHGPAVDGRTGDASGEVGRGVEQARGRLGPEHRLLGPHVDGRGVALAREQDVAGDRAKQVFGVAADVHVFVAVYADAAQHQQPGLFAPHVLEHLLERFAVEQRDLQIDAFLFGDPPGYFEV